MQMNQLVTAQQSANALVPRNISEALELANVMSAANLIPDHLRGKPGDCLLIVMQAQRWGMDAVSVAQSTSVVHGKLCYEGKLVAAALYAMGALDGRLHYDIRGSGQSASITVTGTPKGGKGPQTVTGSVKDWRTYGKDKQGNRIDNAWDKMPEDMLVYRGTRQWARRYAPEALLGVYTPDEIEGEVIDATVLSVQPQQPPKYPQDDFDRNIQTWHAVISRGMRTADEIIAMAETRGSLTDDQRAKIREAKPADDAPQSNGGAE
jgi:hypothetical protein